MFPGTELEASNSVFAFNRSTHVLTNSGARAFMLGNMWDFVKFSKERAKSSVPLRSAYPWLMD